MSQWEWMVPILKMGCFSCLLQLLWPPEIWGMAQTFMSEREWLALLKCRATGLLTSPFLMEWRCSANLSDKCLPVSVILFVFDTLSWFADRWYCRWVTSHYLIYTCFHFSILTGQLLSHDHFHIYIYIYIYIPWFWILLCFLSNKGPSLETLDNSWHFGITQTFLIISLWFLQCLYSTLFLFHGLDLFYKTKEKWKKERKE